MIKFKDSVCFNITDDRTIIAEVILLHVPHSIKKKYPHLSGSDALYMHRLWVRKKDRNKGLGSIVLRMAYDYANDNGITLVLRCNPFDVGGLSRKKLSKFYWVHGFHPLRGSKELFTTDRNR